MRVPPADWSVMLGHFRAAQVARDILRNPDTDQIDRDAAIIAYTRASDAVIDALGRLSERQVLGRVTLFLCRAVRA